MTEFEQKLLQHLEDQAQQLAALSLSQSQTTQALAKQAQQLGTLSQQQAKALTALEEIQKSLQKEPSGESLEATLKAALQPLESNLAQLITSFNSLLTVSQQLSNQLPAPAAQ